MGKDKMLKRKRDENTAVAEPEVPHAKRSSDTPFPKKVKWINKQRVLVFASRGINHRDRHLMQDMKTLMPHHKAESKMERSKNLFIVNEMCQMKNCNKAVMFEGRKKKDLYMWMSNVSQGPSVKFLVENVYTMAELKMTGNCLRGSRPILSFDSGFTEKPQYILLKRLLTLVFGVPNHHPKSQPFFDHVYTFTLLDNRIWFRNFQILSEDGALAEVGPRFALNPVKIFDGSFGGQTIWDNPRYVSPAKYRQIINKKANQKYVNRVEKKGAYEASRPKTSYNLNPLDEMFGADPLKLATTLQELGPDSEKENNSGSSDENETKAEEKEALVRSVKKNKKKNKKQKYNKNNSKKSAKANK